MEFLHPPDYQDLEDGFYFFPGGYLIMQEGQVKILQHDDQLNNFEHLHKKHKCRGRLPEKYLEKVQLTTRRLSRGEIKSKREAMKRLLE